MTPSHGQAFAIEQFRFRKIVHIDGEQILAPLEMTIFQCFLRHGNELAARIGGARRLGEPLDFRRPQNVLLTLHEPFDIRIGLFVGVDGNTFAKLVVGLDAAKVILLTKLGESSGLDQLL